MKSLLAVLMLPSALLATVQARACPDFSGEYVDSQNQNTHMKVTQSGCSQLNLSAADAQPMTITIDGIAHTDDTGKTTTASWKGGALSVIVVQNANQFSETVTQTSSRDLVVSTVVTVNGQQMTNSDTLKRVGN